MPSSFDIFVLILAIASIGLSIYAIWFAKKADKKTSLASGAQIEVIIDDKISAALIDIQAAKHSIEEFNNDEYLVNQMKSAIIFQTKALFSAYNFACEQYFNKNIEREKFIRKYVPLIKDAVKDDFYINNSTIYPFLDKFLKLL